ncbi:MAG: hypothetical protein ACPGSD_05810 [Flavobacteriales bacterium]
MKHLQGILEVMIGMFHPFYVFDNKIKQKGNPKTKYKIAFLFVVLLGFSIFHFMDTKAYVTVNINVMSKIGFLTAIISRILLTSYFITLVSKKIIKVSSSFNKALPIVLIAIPTLFYPFLIQSLHLKNYWTIYDICFVWYLTILSIGIWKTYQCHPIKSVFIALISQLFYWFIGVTLFAWGMKM